MITLSRNIPYKCNVAAYLRNNLVMKGFQIRVAQVCGLKILILQHKIVYIADLTEEATELV
jgi:hypothetical protein